MRCGGERRGVIMTGIMTFAVLPIAAVIVIIIIASYYYLYKKCIIDIAVVVEWGAQVFMLATKRIFCKLLLIIWG